MIFNFLKEYNKFLKNFFKNWKETGSIAPSSKFLAEKMIKGLDFRKNQIIVELGMGTGSITKHILKRMNKKSILLAFETNNDFCNFVGNSIKDSRLKIINDSAINLNKYLHNKKANYIVSGLPIANFSNTDKDLLLKEIKNSLDKEGQYIQFQYTKESYKKVKSLFSSVKIDFTLLSIPPAFVYKCRK